MAAVAELSPAADEPSRKQELNISIQRCKTNARLAEFPWKLIIPSYLVLSCTLSSEYFPLIYAFFSIWCISMIKPGFLACYRTFRRQTIKNKIVFSSREHNRSIFFFGGGEELWFEDKQTKFYFQPNGSIVQSNKPLLNGLSQIPLVNYRINIFSTAT